MPPAEVVLSSGVEVRPEYSRQIIPPPLPAGVVTVTLICGVTFPTIFGAYHIESQPFPAVVSIRLATPIFVKAFVPSDTAVTSSVVDSTKTAAMRVFPVVVLRPKAAVLRAALPVVLVALPTAVWMSAMR